MNFLALKPFLSLGVGGVIALVAIGALLKININDISHLETAVTKQKDSYEDIQKDTNTVLRSMTSAIEKQSGALDKNTQVLNQLLIQKR